MEKILTRKELKEKWAIKKLEREAHTAFIKAKRAELKEIHGEMFQWKWVDFLFELNGISNHPTAKKIDTLTVGEGIKHILAILDTKGNVLKVGSTQNPKSYLLSYLIAWDTPNDIKELYNQGGLPDVEVLEENLAVEAGRKKQKQFSSNKEGLKRTIKIKRILS
jgi:hypothetical protein